MKFLITPKDEETTGSFSCDRLSAELSKTSVPDDSKNHNDPRVWTNRPPQGKVGWFKLAGTYVMPMIGRRSTTGNSNLEYKIEHIMCVKNMYF